MKRLLSLFLALLFVLPVSFASADTLIEPAYPVPDYVAWLLDVAIGELGYTEGPHGVSKYGQWHGDPYAQWCAEFLCWCVDQVDQRHGTHLLRHVYPLYSGTNTGKNWFMRQGRYIARNGNIEGWGYQWLKGEQEFITTGSYIPQPGDWVFFTWTGGSDTDHVAMVEYCTRAADGLVTVHVIEGNNPSQVARNTYELENSRILGYGTVHDAADWTIRSGCSGVKVTQLQERMIYLGLLPEGSADGYYGPDSIEAIRAFQTENQIKGNGIANIATQYALEEAVKAKMMTDPSVWQVVDDEED